MQRTKGLVEAVPDYGDIICRHAAASDLKPLDSVHHSALRFFTGDPDDTASLAQRCDKYLFIDQSLIALSPPYKPLVT